MVLKRLYILANLDMFIVNIDELSPSELACRLIDVGACDPVKIFIKNEPHNKEKVRTKRLRLISSVSLIDQLVERILFAKQNKCEIEHWPFIPSKPGMGLDDESAFQIWSSVVDHLKSGQLVEADLSAFDITVQGWELQVDMLIRMNLCGLAETSPGGRMMLNRGIAVSNSVFVLSDGTMWAQREPGIQLSGSYNTSSTNSRIRVLQAYLAGASWAIAMGDDCLEGPGDPEVYHKLGKTLKMYNNRTDSFEFCSQEFHNGIAAPVDGSKTFFRLLNQPAALIERQGPELLAQFKNDMRHSPQLAEMLEVLERVGWGDPQNNGE